VLDSVASMNKRVNVGVLNGQAYSTSMWR
jgi:hypothetical protein